MIAEKVNSDIKKAMIAKEVEKRDALRFLKSKIQQIEIDSRKEATDDDVVKVIKKLIKQNRDSLSFNPSNKDKIIQEISIWEGYLPSQIGTDELRIIIENIVSTYKLFSIKDIGKVMGLVKNELGSKVDMSSASALAKDILKS